MTGKREEVTAMGKKEEGRFEGGSTTQQQKEKRVEWKTGDRESGREGRGRGLTGA